MIIPQFSKFSKKQTCLFGAMLGDALGVPFEFKSPKNIIIRDIWSPNNIPKQYKSYPHIPLGVYSDDFSQALCVEECITNKDKAFNAEMLEWMDGKYWVDNTLFDIGNQTSKALSHHKKHGDTLSIPEGSGNGGIMRLAPVAFAPGIDHDWGIFVREVIKYTELTHGNPECINAAIFYVTLLALTKNKQTYDDFDYLWSTTTAWCGWSPLSSLSKPKLGSGYVIDTLLSIRHCIKNSTNYREAICEAILWGDDTDTTATCVGAVAALYYGLTTVPLEWIGYIQPSLQNEYVQKLFKDVL